MKYPRRLRRALVAGPTILAAFATVLSLTAAASPASTAQQVGPARASCTVTDGKADQGQRIGGNPVRFQYPDSPYLGARLDRCTGKIYLYYSQNPDLGYATHYNIRWGTNQYEARGGYNRKFTFNDPRDPRPGIHTFMVQACIDGGFLESDTCGRWSPEVRLPRR
jgi:hypothetical protein